MLEDQVGRGLVPPLVEKPEWRGCVVEFDGMCKAAMREIMPVCACM